MTKVKNIDKNCGDEHKVVYNDMYGGFSLSEAAQEWFRQHGHPEYAMKYPHIPRHDPLLVQCVEELGSDADGTFAKLSIAKIKGNKYIIEEYDGWESVYTPDEIEWIIIEK